MCFYINCFIEFDYENLLVVQPESSAFTFEPIIQQIIRTNNEVSPCAYLHNSIDGMMIGITMVPSLPSLACAGPVLDADDDDVNIASDDPNIYGRIPKHGIVFSEFNLNIKSFIILSH